MLSGHRYKWVDYFHIHLFIIVSCHYFLYAFISCVPFWLCHYLPVNRSLDSLEVQDRFQKHTEENKVFSHIKQLLCMELIQIMKVLSMEIIVVTTPIMGLKLAADQMLMAIVIIMVSPLITIVIVWLNLFLLKVPGLHYIIMFLLLIIVVLKISALISKLQEHLHFVQVLWRPMVGIQERATL